VSPRISAALEAAQTASVRETGLKVAIIQDNLNNWEYIAGESFSSDIYLPVAGSYKNFEREYYKYRGGAAICVLSNGNIVRVRNGNPADLSDRKLYVQEITDPTDPSQWTTWSLLYSGNHYGRPEIMANGTSYVVYHAKVDGLYRNNSLEIVPMDMGENGLQLLQFSPVRNHLDAGWITLLGTDLYDDNRVMVHHFTDNVVSPTYYMNDNSNFRRWASSIAGWMVGSEIHRVQYGPLYVDCRSKFKDSIWHQVQTGLTNRLLDAPQLLRGLGGAGLISFEGIFLYQFSDGFYYLFTGEVHDQIVGDAQEHATNLSGLLLTWTRSKDLVHWSQPVIGPPALDVEHLAGAVERNGYIYWADNGQAWRRPMASTSTQLENYIPSLSFSIPRDNQSGSGSAVVANPDNVNSWLLDVSDYELQIQAGIKTAAGNYEFVEFDRFFLKRCLRVTDGAVSRINMPFGNLWQRLEAPLKDTYNFVGKLEWADWSAGKKNQTFNYYFASDTSPSVVGNRLKTTGDVLFAGWRGHNFDMTVEFFDFNADISVLARYKDANNWAKFVIGASTIQLFEKKNGVVDFKRSWGISRTKPCTVRVLMHWNYYELYFNGVMLEGIEHRFATSAPGYVGFSSTASYQVRSFTFEDWEFDYSLKDLLQTALALGDFHDAVVTGADEKAYAVIWGPQTDVPSAAEALRQIMGGLKLQLAYRGGVITLDKFIDRSNPRTLQNTLFSTEHESEEGAHLNVAVVDGNEFFWIYVDRDRLLSHDRQVLGYFDLPELLTLQAVQSRALEEIVNSNKGPQPRGSSILLFDLWRMDYAIWIDNLGQASVVRIEGIDVDLSQSETPFQRMKLDTATLSDLSPTFFIGIESAEAVGTPTILLKGVIYPASINSAEAVGTPTV